MRFGKTENNYTFKFINFVFAILIFFNCATFVACQTKEQKVESALKQCQQLLDKDDLEGATQCYAEAAIKHPENDDRIIKAGDEAFFGKCVEYKNKKDVDKTLKCFYAVAGLLPDKANVHFQLADAYLQYAKEDKKVTGFYDTEILNRAEAAVKKGLEINPDDAPAHGLYSDILEAKNNLRGALKQRKQAVKLDPKADIYLIYLAFIQEKLNENEEAINSYNEALTIKPDRTLVLYKLGKLYETTNKPEKAIEVYETLLKIETPYDDAEERLKTLKDGQANKNQMQEGTVKKNKSKSKGLADSTVN